MLYNTIIIVTLIIYFHVGVLKCVILYYLKTILEKKWKLKWNIE